ncbi:hypothetical protein F383_00493 [Gossypium arboreum]|uniref:Uncharacterized protein n=1 Tax=Gossypium arboreum TaxID=29729 RepID=A0A0B0P4V2_GOSAR|nr:hypothetical protein F383_00493 [Gossypium arboreum]
MPWSYLHITFRNPCHDICILDIPKVHTGPSDVITRSNRTRNIVSKYIHIRLS